MSIFKNTVSVTRYKVTSDSEFNKIDAVQKMKNNQIQEIEMGDDLSFGWSSLADPYEPFFDDLSFMTGQFFTASIRIDRKKVPLSLLKKELHLAEKKELQSLNQQGKKLTKETKNQIKEATLKNLLSKMQAIPASYDVIWDGSDNLYLFSTAKSVREIFEVLMTETFDVSIRMVFPLTMALNDFEESILSGIIPTNFS